MKKSFNLKNFLIPSIVALLTLIVWHKVLYQAFLGEGYYFLLNNKLGGGAPAILVAISRMDLFARLFFKIGPKVFSDNIGVYMYLMLLTMVLVNLCFYWLVYALTRKKVIALMASIFFLANYASSYEIFAIGFYQNFIARIPNLIPAFLSFILFVKFLKGEGKIFTYLASIFLYFVATLMAHFSLYFLSMYPFYALAFFLKKKNLFFLSLPFFLVSFPLVLLEKKFDPETLMRTMLNFNYIFQSFDSLTTVPYQLVLIALPGKILALFTEPQIHLGVLGLFLPVVILYFSGIVYLYRKDKFFGMLAISSVLFIVISLFLNVCLREEQVHTVYGTSRYFYVPFIALSIFWAIFLYVLLYQRNFLGKIFLLGIVCWWLVDNTNLIWSKMDQAQKYHRGVQISIEYIKENIKQFPQDAFVVTHDGLGFYGSQFCKDFYGNEKMTITPIFASWEDYENFNLKNLIVLDYDFEKRKVVNKTEEFKQLIENRKRLGEEEFKRLMKEKKTVETEKGDLIN